MTEEATGAVLSEPVYVFGHKNPDTDSIVSAMAYASLCNALGEGRYVAARLGHLNDETTFLLKRFGFEPPVYLKDVRTQVLNIDYDRPPLISSAVPISHAWSTLHENASLSALPVTNEDGTLYGIVTAGRIAEHDMNSIAAPMIEDVPIFNLLSALEGHVINHDDDVFDTISGRVTIALPSLGAKADYHNAIVICGDQEDVITAAL